MKNIISRSIFLCTLALLALPFRCAADTAVCHVVDPSGKPVANATVYSSSSPMLGISGPTYTTDKSGNFTIDNADLGESRIYMIDAAGFAPTGGTVAAGDNTFTLRLPTKLTGKVVDPKGQPVVGAVVFATYATVSDAQISNSPSQHFSSFAIQPFADRYTVKTDSTGTYTLDNLPMDSGVSVQLNDPRFVASLVVSDMGAAEAPPLTAVPGTSISGKVIRQDENPIGSAIKLDAELDGIFRGMAPASRVAADGTYKITGIPTGSYSVSLYALSDNSETTAWALPAPVDVTATLDTPGTAPDLVLTSSGLVTGSVLDAVTKQPIPGLALSFQDSAVRATRGTYENTGADGKFNAHVWAGKVFVNIYNTPDDYVSDSNAQALTVTSVAGQTVTLDTVLLKRALVVTGVAVDDSGSPVANVTLTTQAVKQDGNWLNIPTATTSNKGAFSIHHLVPGAFSIDAGPGWTVVSPISFTVPSASPIKLVLKKAPTAAIHGTVVDTSSTPVAGVDTVFYVDHDTADGSRTVTQVDAISGSDGKFTLPDAPVDSTLLQRVSVTKDGYVYKSGGDISALNSQVVVSPIVMAQLGGKVDGIVYNGIGKPVAGAWVFSPDSGNDAAPVQTDGAGHFELSNLAVGIVTVDAAKGLYFSRSAIQATAISTPTSIQLPAVPTAPVGPPNLTKAVAMLTKNINEQLAQKNQQGEAWLRQAAAHIIAGLSPDAAVNFILSSSSISTWDLGSIVSARTGSDPLGVASWALVPIKRMSDNSGRALTAMEIGLAAAPYDRAAAQPYYDIATQYVHFDHFNEDSIMSAMRLTALAYALHRPEADSDYAKVSAWLDDLVKSAKNEPNTSSSADWLPRNLVMILALGSVDKALAMLETQPINSRYNTASEIISELVKPNPAGALAVYHWVKQQAASPASERAAERALRLVLPIIYKTDPKGAILQAHSIMDPNTQAQALTDLADQMPPAAAAPLYQEAENKAEGRYGYSPACIACHAWQRDQVLGAKLFNIAYTKFITTSGSMQLPFGQGPSYSDFAFYYSHIDTALSRILIEEQFTKDSMGHGQYYHGDSIQSDVAAMCAIDINRADEMAGTIKDQERRFLAGLKPAQYLLLTPQQRSAVPFSQWSNRSQWTPGTPLN